MKGQFVVVGLGRLGIFMGGILDSLGHEVRAINKRRDVIQSRTRRSVGGFPLCTR